MKTRNMIKIERQIKNIKDKINKLKSLDKYYKVFGSTSHKYLMNPILSINEIRKFEKDNNIYLPEDYKLFLLEIGNGGAGPFYGLLKLYDNEDQHVQIKKPFPFNKKNPCLLSKYSMYDEKINNSKTDEEEQLYWDEKEEKISKEYNLATQGITFLCHHGCAIYDVLILNGKEKSTVWNFNFADEIGVVPLETQNGQLMFLDWYELWLNETIEKCKILY